MEPRKKIEFLANEVMGDLIALMDRIEALPAMIADAEGQLKGQSEVAVAAAIAIHSDDVQQAAIKTLEAVAAQAAVNVRIAGEVATGALERTAANVNKTLESLVGRLEKATKIARWGVMEIFWYILLATAMGTGGTVYLLKMLGVLH